MGAPRDDFAADAEWKASSISFSDIIQLRLAVLQCTMLMPNTVSHGRLRHTGC